MQYRYSIYKLPINDNLIYLFRNNNNGLLLLRKIVIFSAFNIKTPQIILWLFAAMIITNNHLYSKLLIQA